MSNYHPWISNGHGHLTLLYDLRRWLVTRRSSRSTLRVAARSPMMMLRRLNLTWVNHWLCWGTAIDDIIVDIVIRYNIRDVLCWACLLGTLSLRRRRAIFSLLRSLLVWLSRILNYFIVVHNIFHFEELIVGLSIILLICWSWLGWGLIGVFWRTFVLVEQINRAALRLLRGLPSLLIWGIFIACLIVLICRRFYIVAGLWLLLFDCTRNRNWLGWIENRSLSIW